MHEASIAQSIIDQITDLRQQGVIDGELERIRLKVGRLSTVVPDYLTFIFGVMVQDTDLHGVELEIEDIPVRARCQACGAEDEVLEACFLCGRCGSPELDILTGRELLIDSVEVRDGP